MAANEALRTDLFRASQKLSNLCLFSASKWCAEALNGLPAVELPVLYQPEPLTEADIADQDKFLLAKAYFQCKEFERAAQTLSGCKSGEALFLRLYSIFISVDKKAREETDGSINPATFTEDTDPKLATENFAQGAHNFVNFNSRLSKLGQEIEVFHANNPQNAFLLFLNGMIYNKKKAYSLAQTNLINSLALYPYNWSCWQELLVTLINYDEATTFMNQIKQEKSTLSSHVMFQFFKVVIFQEFYQQSPQLTDLLSSLMKKFPKLTYLKVQQFLIAYHLLDYFQAEKIFDQILLDEPLRLDDTDTYSNMLYVMEKKSKLSYLAQFASQIDKYRPETCCIIANYHSMKGQHEKAIMYYKRALTLDEHCLSAWTLMGHEFVEVKNSHAAIESYRRAVDIKPKDFRAWYGLGQAYEVLDMHLYALYYYQRATTLQPLDKRMWQAIGNCYEKIEKYEEALKSFEKALTIDHGKEGEATEYEPHICYRLAVISGKLRRLKEQQKYMKLCLEEEETWGASEETSKARLWLARNALENRKYKEAYEYARDLNHGNAHDVEEARSIAREARNRMLN